MTLPTEDARLVKDLAIASLAAGVGAYVRARRNPTPLSWDRCVVVGAEAVLCAFLAFGAGPFLDLPDRTTSYAIAAALGLVGTAVISDGIMKLIQTRSDRTNQR